jgi:hypothetical protein
MQAGAQQFCDWRANQAVLVTAARLRFGMKLKGLVWGRPESASVRWRKG